MMRKSSPGSLKTSLNYQYDFQVRSQHYIAAQYITIGFNAFLDSLFVIVKKRGL